MLHQERIIDPVLHGLNEKALSELQMLKYDRIRSWPLGHFCEGNCNCESERAQSPKHSHSSQSHIDQLWVEGVLAWEKSCCPSRVITTLAAVPTQHSQSSSANVVCAKTQEYVAVCPHLSVVNDVWNHTTFFLRHRDINGSDTLLNQILYFPNGSSSAEKFESDDYIGKIKVPLEMLLWVVLYMVYVTSFGLYKFLFPVIYIFVVTLATAISICQPLWSMLIYLNNYWIDCLAIWY